MLDAIGRCIQGADRVIVGCTPQRRQAWADALRGAGVSVEIVAPELDRTRPLRIAEFASHTTVVVATGPLGHGDQALKRALDLAIVFGTAPLTLPLLLIAAIAIKLESPGPVLFVQERMGQGNRLFRMFKLRTMRHDSCDAVGHVSTGRLDPRVTRVGALLRRSSIDELPQLFNVLKGQMSVVGPRPHALGSRATDAAFWTLERRYWDRHAAKPGMTGLAQVRGFRGAIDGQDALARRVSSDLAYLESWTIWRDLLIIGRTFRVLAHANAF
jgi:lipopolysaccharide/colanic/teichoic acid biosynthesis glycosyltransferase